MPTILVIDDDPTFQDQIQDLLSGAGYEMLRADDGAEGMKLLEKHHRAINLAIVDLSLPGVNGFEIIGAIARRPSAIRIIATTAIYNDAHLQAAGTLGAHAIIRKPAPGGRLLERDWLETVRNLAGPVSRETSAAASPKTGTGGR
jgi:CheY-like chemotaxis protein